MRCRRRGGAGLTLAELSFDPRRHHGIGTSDRRDLLANGRMRLLFARDGGLLTLRARSEMSRDEVVAALGRRWTVVTASDSEAVAAVERVMERRCRGVEM